MGAPEGIRTPNLLIRSQVLYPLSYGRLCGARVYSPSLPVEFPHYLTPLAWTRCPVTQMMERRS